MTIPFLIANHADNSQDLAQWASSLALCVDEIAARKDGLKNTNGVETQSGMVVLGQTSNELFFNGVIHNQAQLCESLSLDAEADIRLVLATAIETYGEDLPDYVFGDYCLVWWNNAQQVTAMRSYGSSYSLYVCQKNQSFMLGDSLTVMAELHTDKVEAQSILQSLMLMGPLEGRTLYQGIRQILPGEMCSWSLSDSPRLLSERVINFPSQDAPIDPVKAERIVAPPTLDDVETRTAWANDSFQALPSVINILGEAPVSTYMSWLYLALQEIDEDVVSLDNAWFSDVSLVETRHSIDWARFYGSILRRSITQPIRAVVANVDGLRKAFEVHQAKMPSLTGSFDEWFTNNQVMPVFKQQMQRIANALGKRIIFKSDLTFSTEQKATSATQTTPVLFSLEDVGACNVYEAMQRIFYLGNKSVMSKLFKLDPYSSSRVVLRLDDDGIAVERFCIQLISLDYLARFNRWQLV